jgi:hypothetical protein
MYNSAHDLLDALRAGPEALAGLLRTCSPEQAHNARGGDEGWSIVEVVCHLRDAEERALERTLAMIATENPFLAAYDQAQWARERHYAGADLQEALQTFQDLRVRHVAALDALPPQGWERTGRHEEQGQITITGHIVHMTAHDMIHAAQIARQLQQ